MLHDDFHYYIVSELVTDGTLFDYLLKQTETKYGAIHEAQAKLLIKQVLYALNYMHLKKIAHRDIKLENILVTSAVEPLEVKLTDFGFASVLDENHMFKDSLGSPNYMAPELVKKEPYDEKVDVWATGCVLYSMLSGTMAFDADNKVNLNNFICLKTPDIKSGTFKKVSKSCKEFLLLMLQRDKNKRPSVEELLQHKWIKEDTKISAQTKKEIQEYTMNMERFYMASNF